MPALEGRHAHMESRMQDAFARATRASEEAEGIRAKLRAEHANVLRLTKQLETVRQGPPRGRREPLGRDHAFHCDCLCMLADLHEHRMVTCWGDDYMSCVSSLAQ